MSDNYLRLMGFVHSVEFFEGKQDESTARLTFAVVEDYPNYHKDGKKKDSKGFKYDIASRWHNFVCFDKIAKALRRRLLSAERVMVETTLDYTTREVNGAKTKQPRLVVRRFDGVTVLTRKRLPYPCPHCNKEITVDDQRNIMKALNMAKDGEDPEMDDLSSDRARAEQEGD